MAAPAIAVCDIRMAIAIIDAAGGRVPSMGDLMIFSLAAWLRRGASGLHRSLTWLVELCLRTVSPLAEVMLGGTLLLLGITAAVGEWRFRGTLTESLLAREMQDLFQLWIWSVLLIGAGGWHCCGLLLWRADPKSSLHSRRASSVAVLTVYLMLALAVIYAAPFNLTGALLCFPLAGAGCVDESQT